MDNFNVSANLHSESLYCIQSSLLSLLIVHLSFNPAKLSASVRSCSKLNSSCATVGSSHFCCHWSFAWTLFLVTNTQADLKVLSVLSEDRIISTVLYTRSDLDQAAIYFKKPLPPFQVYFLNDSQI